MVYQEILAIIFYFFCFLILFFDLTFAFTSIKATYLAYLFVFFFVIGRNLWKLGRSISIWLFRISYLRLQILQIFILLLWVVIFSRVSTSNKSLLFMWWKQWIMIIKSHISSSGNTSYTWVGWMSRYLWCVITFLSLF